MRDAPRAPLIIARGGASADAPEHTIAAFELALSQGADGLELDVHLSRDAQPVVIHDFTVERTTDGAGPVSEYSVRELKRLDAGGWRGRPFQGQRIQTLQEVFERFRGRTRFWVTLRGGPDLYCGIEERVTSTIEIYDVLEQSLVQSLDPRALQELARLNGGLRLAAIVAGPSFDPAPHAGAGLHAVSADAALITERGLAAGRAARLDCYAWTLGEPALVGRLTEWGISGIITDQPGLLRSRLSG